MTAAPETETDASGLTEAEKESLNVAVDEAETCVCCGDDYGSTHVYAAVERIVAERVRVVEGERDAWKRERDEYVSSICFETTCTNCAHMLDQLAATRELVDGDHIEAAKSQRIKAQQGALAILRTDRDHHLARAESAEAAHEAEKAAHERLRAEVEEKIAQYSRLAGQAMDPECREWLTAFVGTLRSLLGGGAR